MSKERISLDMTLVTKRLHYALQGFGLNSHMCLLEPIE